MNKEGLQIIVRYNQKLQDNDIMCKGYYENKFYTREDLNWMYAANENGFVRNPDLEMKKIIK